MRVMVSLNLADIMTSTRPGTSQCLRESLDNEADATSLGREEPQLLAKSNHSETLDRERGAISTQV